MAKLKLIPDPTFEAKVAVPVPGAGTVDVKFTFKNRSRDEMRRLTARCNPESPEYEPDMTDLQMVMECACGWELADAFTEDNVKTFCANYIAGPAAVFETYVAEMAGARLKNSGRPRL